MDPRSTAAAALSGGDARLLAVGLDGARGGWAAALLFADDVERGRAAVWRVVPALLTSVDEIAGLRARHGGGATVAIDIPIGLLDTVRLRACDDAARRCLSGRKSTVFAPPARYMLGARDYAEVRARVAQRRAVARETSGISAQAAGLLGKIEEVDGWIRRLPDPEPWLFECHPETSFRALAGEVLAPKTSATGALQRVRLVDRQFPGFLDALREDRDAAGRVSLIDMLDACAALWTAIRCRTGHRLILGDGTVDTEIGMPMRIAV